MVKKVRNFTLVKLANMRDKCKKNTFYPQKKKVYMAHDSDKLEGKAIDLIVNSKAKQICFNYFIENIEQPIRWRFENYNCCTLLKKYTTLQNGNLGGDSIITTSNQANTINKTIVFLTA